MMSFKKKSHCFIAFLLFLNIGNVHTSDFLDKLSSNILFWPCVCQAMFFFGICVGEIRDTCKIKRQDDKTRQLFREELQSSLQEVKTEMQQLKNEIRSVRTQTAEFYDKITNEQITKPIVDAINLNNANWVESTKNFKEIIKLIHEESLPEMEKRLTARIMENISLFQQNSIQRDIELDKKLNAFIMYNNTKLDVLAAHAAESKDIASKALSQIEKFKLARKRLPSVQNTRTGFLRYSNLGKIFKNDNLVKFPPYPCMRTS